jgi:hypothetical protein
MAHAAKLYAALAAAGALAGCGSGPPRELSGLWSAGPAACAAHVGVRFGQDAITAVYDKQREALFEHPRYDVEERGEAFRVRIVYALPQQAGGAVSAGAHGVLLVVRDPDGGLRAVSHTLVDPRTGSVRMRIADDPALEALALKPCGPVHRGAGLRGRGET